MGYARSHRDQRRGMERDGTGWHGMARDIGPFHLQYCRFTADTIAYIHVRPLRSRIGHLARDQARWCQTFTTGVAPDRREPYGQSCDGYCDVRREVNRHASERCSRFGSPTAPGRARP